MNKVNLYNQDGSLCSEAQPLISPKPDDVSMTEWRKRMKGFKSSISAEDLQTFERLRKNKKSAEWYAKNPEKSIQFNANWKYKNPEKAKETNARWYAENPENSKESNAKWRAENPEKAKESHAIWRAENHEHVLSQARNYNNQRRAKDPLYRLQRNMRSTCSRIVKQLSLGKKPASTFKWIGCSAEELQAHLESLFTEGMTWENYGEWHVDHIRPVCSFTAEEWEQVNHYTNLQPLWAEDNLLKGDSW